jgi:16S rRNA (adenine1518-N6/adenine1519-N6)-dimethyltransferase
MTTHIARKRFGQNFLHDYSIIQHILACTGAKAGEHWLEIGPGQGALTTPLLQKGVILDVVELDRDLVTLLEQRFAGVAQLTIHSADALRFDVASCVQNAEPLHIIGNLPYNISTPLLFHLLTSTAHIAAMYFMLQEEVVDRLCAAPNSKQYGKLTIMMQYYCAVEKLFTVPPESFEPIPKVMSAVVKLVPHAAPPVAVTDVSCLRQVVTTAFSQRRKTLRNALSTLISAAEMETLGINPTARAETLSLQAFAQLSNAVAARTL